jgi:hypothetical protein
MLEFPFPATLMQTNRIYGNMITSKSFQSRVLSKIYNKGKSALEIK